MVHRHRGVRRVAVIENHIRKYSTRILLVEDHASFRQALAFMFEREQEFIVTGQAGSLAEARVHAEGA
jgi:CheY-like chemotaxis protein